MYDFFCCNLCRQPKILQQVLQIHGITSLLPLSYSRQKTYWISNHTFISPYHQQILMIFRHQQLLPNHGDYAWMADCKFQRELTLLLLCTILYFVCTGYCGQCTSYFQMTLYSGRGCCTQVTVAYRRPVWSFNHYTIPEDAKLQPISKPFSF